MKRIAIALALGLSTLITPVQAVSEWTNIALTVGRWIYLAEAERDDSRAYQIRVQAVGKTEEEARKQAFAFAVDKAVGSLLVSETESYNQNIVRKELLNYSSGYVYDFKTLDREQAGNLIKVVMDVWVKESGIANRISTNTKSSTSIAVGQAFDDIKRENTRGDRLLKTVLDGYPSRSFDITTTNVGFSVENRQRLINVDYEVTWKPGYIGAVKDAMSHVGKKTRSRDTHTPGLTFVDLNCNFLTCDTKTYRTDPNRGQFLVVNTINKQPRLMVTFYDTRRNVMSKQCYHVPNLSSDSDVNLLSVSMYNVQLYPDVLLRNKLKLDIGSLDATKLDQVDLSIVSKNKCKT